MLFRKVCQTKWTVLVDRIITLMLDRKMLMRWKSPTVSRADEISDKRTFCSECVLPPT